MTIEWLLNIKKQVDKQNIPFFFKQWGIWNSDGKKRNKKENGHLINGKVYQAMP